MLKRTLLCVGLVMIWLLPGLRDACADVEYKVKRGDTLFKIARQFGVKPQEIRQANDMRSSALKRNQVLTIPEKTSLRKSGRGSSGRPADPKKTEIYRVKKGDTLRNIALMADCSEKQIRRMNHLKSGPLKVGRRLILPSRPEQPVVTEADEALGEEAVPEEVIQAEVREELQRQNPDPVIGKWTSPEERNLFIRVVKTFLGVPYRYGGSTLKGLDCSAFVKRVYEIVDISLPRTAREQSLSGKWVAKGELEEGDLVFFRTRRINDHVGIYIGKDEFVHLSSRNKAAKIDNLNESYFQKRFIRGVRVKELQSNGSPPAQASLKS